MVKSRKAPAARRLPRIPLPRQAGHRHDDETKKPWRDRKHKKRSGDDA
jgi:hypothetical protein